MALFGTASKRGRVRTCVCLFPCSLSSISIDRGVEIRSFPPPPTSLVHELHAVLKINSVNKMRWASYAERNQGFIRLHNEKQDKTGIENLTAPTPPICPFKFDLLSIYNTRQLQNPSVHALLVMFYDGLSWLHLIYNGPLEQGSV
ncbi:hypothetical protein CEXT_760201 [Caerostris extrusa]|uniref:Uncharacterized protein n=1 Tax=Caerostris extrusa TaxID=172846 RepID=A0AAV4T7A1_CAEEX|nr:hypothetical protein CEXT_760201 [Caerostris extrusa]